MTPRQAISLTGALVLTACGGDDGGSDAFTYDCSVFPPAAQSPYILPWRVGETHEAFPHAARTAPSPQMYADDLGMAIGTPVLAVQDGMVVRVVENFSNDDHLFGHENAVYIQHADGTVARYLHLTTNGALVAVGDGVLQGQQIALSGNSGQSKGPHLHFDVTSGCCAIPPDYNTLPEGQTQPLTFRNAGVAHVGTPADISCGLRNEVSYRALPY
jgi:murein DD-endopeptidase MepM/ murein hydrolase activator NlpD